MAGKTRIGDDSELTAARKKSDHGRGEKTRDTVNKCFNFGIYVLTAFVLLVMIAFTSLISYHMYDVRDYAGMLKALSYMGTAGGAYLVAYLKNNGVTLS